MIVVNIKGGIGNQMFQYAYGRMLSYQLNTALLLDLSWFENPGSDTSRKYVLDKFAIQATVAGKHDLMYFEEYKKGFKKILNHFLPVHKKKIVVEKGQSFNNNYLELNDTVLLIGTWMNERYFYAIKEVIRTEFKINAQFNAYQNSIYGIILQNNAVAVHIRRGDYANNPVTNKFHGLLDKNYYDAAIEIIAHKVTEPCFVFFSDDIDWVKHNFKLNYKHIFITASDAGKEYIDLYLMSQCRHFIIANSTFSWWAAWLNKQEGKITIAPGKWSANIPNSETITPGDWIRI